MNRDFQSEEISAFLDGEMSDEQARAFLAAVDRDPQAAAELQRMLKLRELITDALKPDAAVAVRVPPQMQDRWQTAVRREAALRPAATASAAGPRTATVLRPADHFWRTAVPMAATLLLATGILWYFHAERNQQNATASVGPTPTVAMNEPEPAPLAPTPEPAQPAKLPAADAAKMRLTQAENADGDLPTEAPTNGAARALPVATPPPPPPATPVRSPVPAMTGAADTTAMADADSPVGNRVAEAAGMEPAPAPAPAPGHAAGLPMVGAHAMAPAAPGAEGADQFKNAPANLPAVQGATAASTAMAPETVQRAPDASAAPAAVAAGVVVVEDSRLVAAADGDPRAPAAMVATIDQKPVQEIIRIPYHEQNIILIQRWVTAHGGSARVVSAVEAGEALDGTPFLGFVRSFPSAAATVPELQIQLPPSQTQALQAYVSGLKPTENATAVDQTPADAASATMEMRIEPSQNDK